MVYASTARDDVDVELLTKTITYREYQSTTVDLATEEKDLTDYKDHTIKAQCTVQRFDSKYVSDGVLLEGDLVGLFRYQYEKDANGFLIDPVLIPKSKDEIKFLGQWYSVKQCTPATEEEQGIIGWDFTAGQTTNTTYEVDPEDDC